ncbi:ATP-binding protein [Streptomyces sp. NPDC091281]|uniref:ATP-binding protein n=1 Tax=Streptomyces sp. NPDC091281 TaxID=3365985 RepID=UPI00380F11D5
MDFRTDRSRYPTHRAQVKAARDHVRRVALSWGLDDSLVEALTLMASELATNAVLHSRTRGRQFGVTLTLSPDCVRLAVRDAGSRPPVLRAPACDEPSGRGLVLVDALSDRWSTIWEIVGKTVYAEIRIAPARGHERGNGVVHVQR